MSKQEEAGLILKLYELRRDETMRKARNWFIVEFHPNSLEDYTNAMFSENSAYLRMVATYWEMAAALVNNGAIDLKLFDETNGEHFVVFAKLEPLLPAIRAEHGEQVLRNLEKLIEDTPKSRQRVEFVRERMKAIRTRFVARQATTV
ncbi:MAG: hypothetical protein JOY62_10125 [Acidobacteriaceae bacterium]|nr:hypothetical protein [Acidobacteriaceae bacterium]MBV9780315.1 hypothetical protein [Acidobacteriaceae bacterium]